MKQQLFRSVLCRPPNPFRRKIFGASQTAAREKDAQRRVEFLEKQLGEERAKAKRLEEDLAALRKTAETQSEQRRQKAQQKVELLEQERRDLQAEGEALSKRVGNLEASNKKLRSQLQETRQSLEALEKKTRESTTKLDNFREVVNGLLV